MSRILALDDDRELLGVMKEILSLNGFDVVTSAPTYEIRELILLYHPDLIIMDFLMNDVNGGELCSILKSDESTRDIPVILCSAYDRIIQSLGNYGCDLFVSKPIDFSKLTSDIKNLLPKGEDYEYH
jgi:CheY-like chemotaxis protein